MASASKTLATRLIGFLVYILIGGAIFMEIEKENDKDATTQTFEDLRSKWIQKYNLSKEIITELLQDFDDMGENRAKPTWSFLSSVYFVLQLVTTIGKLLSFFLHVIITICAILDLDKNGVKIIVARVPLIVFLSID